MKQSVENEQITSSFVSLSSVLTLQIKSGVGGWGEYVQLTAGYSPKVNRKHTL